MKLLKLHQINKKKKRIPLMINLDIIGVCRRYEPEGSEDVYADTQATVIFTKANKMYVVEEGLLEIDAMVEHLRD